jgi:hypothetical protein
MVDTIDKRYFFRNTYNVSRFGDPSESETVTNSNPITQTLTKGGPVRNWRSRILRGEYAGTHMSATRRSWRIEEYDAKGSRKEGPPYSLNERDSTYHQWGMPYLGVPDVLLSAPSESDANTRALEKLNKRLTELNQSFAGGVFLGELAKTIHSVRNPVMSLRKEVSKYLVKVEKLGRRERTVRSMRRMIGSTWLEAQYGMLPLASDADSAGQALAEFITDIHNRDFKTIDARYTTFNKSVPSAPQTVAANSTPCTVGARLQRERKSTVRYLACYGVEPSSRNAVIPKLGLGLAAFLPTVWELVPFSFLADYFTNMGDVISGLGNCVNRPRWVMRWVISDNVKRFVDWHMENVSPDLTYAQALSPGVYEVTDSTILRIRHLGELIPDFRFEIPGVTSLKWVNIAALAQQLASARRVTTKPRSKLILLRKGTY